MKCTLCPRNCGVDRSKAVGFCGAGEDMVVAKVMLHEYEEPLLTRENEKSGAIFFSGCSLRCCYCQNSQISHRMVGETLSPAQLAEVFRDLEAAGAGNIDLVTPTHFAGKIAEALKIYKPRVPVIWNTSGYEKPETIRLLDGLVDIYLTDFKYISEETAQRLSSAKDYPFFAKAALAEMKKQVKNQFDGDKMIKGIIVRHLVLPEGAKESIKVLDAIYKILGKEAIVSIMSQYVPMGGDLPEQLRRRLTRLEYKAVTSHALRLGLDNSLVQDLDSASADYTPSFGPPFFEIPRGKK